MADNVMQICSSCGGILLDCDQFSIDPDTKVISIKGSGDYPPGEGPANDDDVKQRVAQILASK